MIANYHTHTWRCNHAKGTEEEYVRIAIDRKFETLGFSDHCPFNFPEEYYAKSRMKQELLDGYCDTVRGLQKQFAGQIQLPLGVEAEYYPAYFQEQVQILRDKGVEYMILGQHFLNNEVGEPYTGLPTDDVAMLKQYCSQSMDGMQTGLFTYYCHPDLIKFTGDLKTYRQHMRRLCIEAKNCGLPLELNLLGKWTGRNYPNPVFWELAAEEGCDVVIGVDAHAPEQLLKLEAEKELMDMVHQFGLNLLETVPLRKI